MIASTRRPPATAAIVCRRPARAGEEHDEARQHEGLRQLGLRPDGHEGQHAEDRPEQRVAPVRRARQPIGRNGDDGDDRGPDAVEHGLHPPEAAVSAICDRDAHHHHEGWHHERQPDQGRAHHPTLEIAERDGELCGQGPGHDLGEGEAEPVFLLVDPAPLLDEVAVHEAGQCDRPPEAEGAEVKEVPEQVAETRARRCRLSGRRHGRCLPSNV
jgi:hypothetical protein